jgi:NAD(P)-dependent dehydrogenase (short-subunit alcohol dehydrogenase family)
LGHVKRLFEKSEIKSEPVSLGEKMSKVVLITGCSTGIGRDLAQRLSRSGYQVVATARQVETLAALQASMKLPLDVTLPDSVEAAVDQTLERFGRIDVLVNNAGYAIRGALEEVPLSMVEHMFEVNVFGALRMIQAVAPVMRRQQAGQIINICSIAGKLSTPTNGAYSATKFALEALSDALRVELAPFGVTVVLVEPGAIQTCFEATALGHTQHILANPGSAYHPLYQKGAQFDASMRDQRSGPEVASTVIQQAIEAPKPKARYLAGVAVPGRLVLRLRDFVWEPVVKRIFSI